MSSRAQIKGVYKIACFILFLISPYMIVSQQLISTTEILRNNSLMESELPYSANINFLDNEVERIPIIGGYQFRTESDEFDIEQQQYSLRFNFNSGKERKAYDKVLSSTKDLYKVMQTEYAQDKIEQIYQSILSSYFIQEELNLLSQEQILLIDKRTVLSKLIQNSDEVEIKNWLSNEDDILSIAIDSIQLATSWNQEQTTLVGSKPKIQIDFTSFINIEKIETIINSIDPKAISTPRIDASNMEIQKAIAEHDLENAEANKWLDFAQIQYKGNNNLTFQKEISLGTSINIPYKGNNQIKKDESALRVLERKYKKEIEVNETSEEISKLIMRFRSEIKEREDLILLVQNQRLQETYNAYLEIDNMSPLILLELQKSILKYNSKLLSNKKKIFELYLEILTKGSYLIKQPRKNYLSNVLDEY